MSLLIAAAALVLFFTLALVPRALVRRAQDRKARERIARVGDSWRLLTRADLVVGRYRRLPGLLGMRDDGLVFEGLFGESICLRAPSIQKIVTGRRMENGRRLLRLEVLRVTPSDGDEREFVLAHAAAEAWRSHLGLWAARERQADADRVTPGRR